MPINETLNATGIWASIEGMGINPLYLLIGGIIAFFVWQHYKKPKILKKKDAIEALEDIDEKVVEKRSYIDISAIPQNYRWYGGIATVILLWYGMSRAWPIQRIGLYLAIGWILIYIMSVGTENTKKNKVLSWGECRLKLWQALRDSQLQSLGGRYCIQPDAEIIIGHLNNVQEKKGGKPYARFMNFAIKRGRKIQYFLARVEPFTGQVMQTSKLLAGWHGDEPTPQRVMLPQELRDELRREKLSKKASS